MEYLLLLIGGAIGGAVGWYIAEERGNQKLRDVSSGWERKVKHIETEVKTADQAHDDTKAKLLELQEALTAAESENQTLRAQLAAADATAAAPAPATQPAGPASRAASDLTQIKGIGKVLAGKLEEIGISSLHDLARLEESELPALKEKLDTRSPVDLVAWRNAAREMVAH